MSVAAPHPPYKWLCEPAVAGTHPLLPMEGEAKLASTAARPCTFAPPERQAVGSAEKPNDEGKSVCEAALEKMRSQNFFTPGELRELPAGYGAAPNFNQRYLPEDYSEAPDRRIQAFDKKPDGTIWSGDFNHSSSLTIGDIQKQLPKPEKLKDLVKYKGPMKKSAVMKQATVNVELQKAIENGDSDMVAALLRFGLSKRCVNVNAPLWPKRERMLHLAVRGDHRDICIMLIEARAELDIEEITDGRHPLHDACRAGAYDTVELLLDRRARIEENTFTGKRPIHWAAGAGHADVVDLLLDRRAQIAAVSSDTKEPLHHAAFVGATEVVRLLCKRGAKVDAETSNGQRPIHLACNAGHLQSAAILMDFGALGVMDEMKHSLRKHQGMPLEEFMRCVEQLRFQRDEAEELHDVGQQEEAEDMFKKVVAGFLEIGLANSAEVARADAERCGATVEPIDVK